MIIKTEIGVRAEKVDRLVRKLAINLLDNQEKLAFLNLVKKRLNDLETIWNMHTMQK